jgi:uncharacterized coiled-coil protein SlyX
MATLRSEYEAKMSVLENKVRGSEQLGDEIGRLNDALENQVAQNDDLRNQMRVLSEENKFLQDDYNDQMKVLDF